MGKGATITNLNGVTKGMAHIEGTDLYYEIAGQGPPLVLVHAGFVDSRMWDEQFSVFAQQYRVLRYDLRGFGKSKLSPGPFSHRQDLHRLLNFVGLERAHLLGCSMGGGVVVDFTLEHPEKVASLVLVSSALGGYPMTGEMPKPMQELMDALQAKDLARAAEIAGRLWIAGPHRTPEQVDKGILGRAREMSLTALPNIFVKEEPLVPPAFERLAKIVAPTLVMVGELDDASIATIGGFLNAHIAASQEEIISGAAHLPSMEKPEEFNRIVLEFFKSQPTFS